MKGILSEYSEQALMFIKNSFKTTALGMDSIPWGKAKFSEFGKNRFAMEKTCRWELWERWEPGGGEGEYGGEGDALGLFWGEAVRPVDAMGGVGTVSMVVVFVVTGGGLALRFPVVPSFGTDMASHLTVHEEGVAIITPWSAKIDAVHTRCGDEPAVVEHISVGLVAWGGCRGDVGVGETLDGAILEPSR